MSRNDRNNTAIGEGLSLDERAQLVPDLLARRFASDPRSYWRIVWDDFRKSTPAVIALWIMVVMAIIGIGAPLIANNRPFILSLSEAAIQGDLERAVLSPGWQSPLLGSLGMVDWILLIGVAQVIAAVIVLRRAVKRELQARPAGVIALLILGMAPLLLVLALAPMDQLFAGPDGVGAPSGMLRIVMAAVAIGGAALLIRACISLFRGERDEFGRPATAPSIRRAFAGSLFVLIAASWAATLEQRKIEIVDYVDVAKRDGVFAIFAPIRHDYLAAETYVISQDPGAPFVRVQATGGSKAAADLGLSDARREANLLAEYAPPGAARGRPHSPLTRDSLLAHLGDGRGVRTNDTGSTDFVVITRSLERHAVLIRDTTTLGDVLDRINTATGGDVVASVSNDGTRIVLSDRTQPRPRHIMGTDSSGSDVAARLIHATRVALSIGFVSTGIAIFIGILMGAAMGYFGGWVDIVGSRIVEIFMAIPRLFLLLTIIAFIPPAWNEYMLYAMMAVLGATSWMNSARFIRAEFLRLRNQDFVQAAQAVGLPLRSVLFKHMLPNGVTPVLVDASFGVAAAIFIETGLSFLGFGIKPPNPSWGKMLSEAVDPATGVFYWWLAVFPGIMIFLTVFAFNIIGDALRDAIDPKLKKAAA